MEWEMSNWKGYNWTINFTEDDPACSYNLPQLQKLPCAHVITTCARERDCANITTYSLCASCYTMENFNKTYA